MPSLPISCKSEPRRKVSIFESSMPMNLASLTVISVTRRVFPSVPLSRRSRARAQPSIVAS